MKEEVSDIFDPKVYAEKINGQYTFHVGKLVKFSSGVSIKITKIDRKNKRMWAEHIELVGQKPVLSHTGHDIDSTGDALEKYHAFFCNDCQVPLTQQSTEDGDRKALERRDYREKNYLPDGTKIDE